LLISTEWLLHNALAAIRPKIAPEKLAKTKVIFKRGLIF
jgi:hypothetical protein